MQLNLSGRGLLLDDAQSNHGCYGLGAWKFMDILAKIEKSQKTEKSELAHPPTRRLLSRGRKQTKVLEKCDLIETDV